ncbi:hypothetical protein PMZ80_006743 [Knufia obscura]|uniref:Uncharacterized protein n=2 Tax=Knufia TaxID=430999 RepID=A0AAN8EMW5_9EURO|nr:hypothetical protein PMZ80_006743 [Knufia obscura]KAK5948268.1 hypothetical protein OHC33_010702 [Knufia fluminis]
MPSLKAGEQVFCRTMFCRDEELSRPTPTRNKEQLARIKSLEAAIRDIFNPELSIPSVVTDSELDHGEKLKDQYLALKAIRDAKIALLEKHAKGFIEGQFTGNQKEQKVDSMRTLLQDCQRLDACMDEIKQDLPRVLLLHNLAVLISIVPEGAEEVKPMSTGPSMTQDQKKDVDASDDPSKDCTSVRTI